MNISKFVLLVSILTIPAVTFGQRQGSYTKKTYKKTTIIDTTSGRSDLKRDPAVRENAPVLNDNGNVNTTGTIDGSRSSTGRAGSDTAANYTRKRRRTITGSGTVAPDTAIKKGER